LRLKEALYFFFLTFWVSADAAADFAALLAVLLRKILEAEEATLALVVSVLPFCVRAEAATDFSALVADLLRRTLEAADATFLLVLSDFAMTSNPSISEGPLARFDEAEPWQIRTASEIERATTWRPFLRRPPGKIPSVARAATAPN